MNMLQDALQHLRRLLARQDTPTPRWQVLAASFYLGMLIYLLLYQSGIV
jgi:hypothetical protein